MLENRKRKDIEPTLTTENTPSETPYLAARREWNERYSDFIVAANNWRLIAFCCGLTSIIAVTGIVFLALQSKVAPYIVETNNFGEVSRVQRADELGKPSEKLIKAALRNWILGARTVYVDSRAQQTLLETTYAMTLPESAAFRNLTSYHSENSPYVRSANETVEVTVHAVVPISGETWQIEWSEVTKQRSGKEIGKQQYQGTFSVSFVSPTNEEQILKNPLGIYVYQYAWSPRIN